MKMLLNHSFQMLYKNIKAYIALSVTIIISLSILLGYLVFVDSNCYNNSKEAFSVSSSYIIAQQESDNAKLKILENMMESNSISYKKYDYYSLGIPQTQYGSSVHATYVCIPSNLKSVYESRVLSSLDINNVYNAPQKLNMLYGREDFRLNKNEAIINRSFFEALGLSEEDLPYETSFMLGDSYKDEGRIKLSIVGVCEDGEYTQRLHYNDDNELDATFQIYVSQASMNGIEIKDFGEVDYYSFIETDSPEKVTEYEKQLGLIECSAYQAQKEALINEKAEKGTKNKIVIMLLLILGVNMFSCLSNVIASRQYEIGIKRAIGAGVFDIVVQFLTESICILVIDIIASMWVVTNIVIGFKFFYWIKNKEVWIFHCSNYSIASFLISSISIIVIFSIVLAYKATKVEIVSQLKCE